MTQAGHSPHEPIDAEDSAPEASPRSFGLVFAVVFALYALSPLRRGGDVRMWALGVAVALALLATAAPRSLSLPSRLWQKFGLLLHAVVNPIVMGALFYVVVTPFGLAMRMFGRGLSGRIHLDRQAASYWIPRTDPGPDAMRQQF